MKLIKDNIGVMGNEPEIALYLLKSMRGGCPVHNLQIQAGNLKALDVIHSKLFEVIKGRYEPNELGRKYGAYITSSSYTIGINTTNIKKLAADTGISTVRLIRYTTL